MPSFWSAVRVLKRDYGINSIVTGDLIDEKSEKFEQYWLRNFCIKEEVKLFCPMGSVPRTVLLRSIGEKGMDVRITGVHTFVLPASLLWTKFGERETQLLLAREKEIPNFDIGGENGEYHTSVLSAKIFDIPIPLLSQETGLFQEVAYLPLLSKRFSVVNTTHIQHLN